MMPLVVRVPYGGGIRAPGITRKATKLTRPHPRVESGRTVDALRGEGIIVAALRDPDPVIFMEPKRIYRSIREEVPKTSM
jgi:pyruvate dehydrogenase E1 component beta subunit